MEHDSSDSDHHEAESSSIMQEPSTQTLSPSKRKRSEQPTPPADQHSPKRTAQTSKILGEDEGDLSSIFVNAALDGAKRGKPSNSSLDEGLTIEKDIATAISQIRSTEGASLTFAYKMASNPVNKSKAVSICPLLRFRRLDCQKPHRNVPTSSSQSNLHNSTPLIPSNSQLDQTSENPRKPRELTTSCAQPLSLNTKGHSFKQFDQLPVEIFEMILSHLARSDAKALRLTNKAVERAVSGTLFDTVVTSFNPEVFGILKDENDEMERVAARMKCCVVSASATYLETSKSAETSLKTNKSLDVFRGFGPHIRRFGITLMVKDFELHKPAQKISRQDHGTYWGSYMWPFPEYPRFTDRAEMEKVADETSVMTRAFAHLTKVQHLALSINSGLGLIGTQDWSIRSEILHNDRPIFGQSRFQGDHTIEARRKLWQFIERNYEPQNALSFLQKAEFLRFPTKNAMHLKGDDFKAFLNNFDKDLVTKTAVVKYKDNLESGNQTIRTPDLSATSTHLPSISPKNDDINHTSTPKPEEDSDEVMSGVDEEGIFVVRPGDGRIDVTKKFKLKPRELSQSQKEWIMETNWAADAFLSSYILSISDNQQSFSNVRTLTFSCFSGRYLPKLFRSDFWDSLPALSTFEIYVLPDYRDIKREEANIVQLPSLQPSESANDFYYVLRTAVGSSSTIKDLKFGWVSGGEHQEGICLRNKELLPAPLCPLRYSKEPQPRGIISFPCVENLKISNAWVTSNTLQKFINKHTRKQMKSITFDSISLTADADPTQLGSIRRRVYNVNPQLLRLFQSNDESSSSSSSSSDDSEDDLAAAPGDPFEIVVREQDIGLETPPLPYVPTVPQAILDFLPIPQRLNQLHGHLTAVDPASLNMTQNQVNVLINLLQPRHHPPGLPAAIANPHPAANPTIPTEAPSASTQLYCRGSWTALLHNVRKGCLRPNHNKDLTLTFLSCGYTKLTSAPFPQIVLDLALAAQDHLTQKPLNHNYFTNRRYQLANQMIISIDPYHGIISTAMPLGEMRILADEWGFQTGWPWSDLYASSANEGSGDDDDDDEVWGKWGEQTKKGAVFDGEREGGTGRFSGRIMGFEWTKEELEAAE